MTDRSIKQAALSIAVISSFLIPFVSSSVTVALPTIGDEFHSNSMMLGWITTSYLLASAMFLVPFGRLSDIRGRKRLLKYGMAIYSVSSLLCIVAYSDTFLVIFRCMQGVGAAMFFAPSMAILVSVFPDNERGKALGISIGTVYVGLSAGPSVGGLMTQHLGWRSLFVVSLALGLVVIALIYTRLKGEWAGAEGEEFDVKGSIIYSAALVATVYGFSHLTKPLGPWLFGAGLVGLVGFVAFERNQDSPVLNVKLFTGNRAFAMSNVAALINYSATAATVFLLSLYLQQIQNLSPQDAGMIMLWQPATQAVFSPFAGRLSDRVEPRVVASVGMGLTAAGLVMLATLADASSLLYVRGILVLLGLGFALFSSPNTNAVMSSVNRALYGIASATVSTFRLVGMTLSMGVVMLLLSLYVGDAKIAPEQHVGFLAAFRAAFTIFAILCTAGVFASLARGKVRT